MEKVVCFSLRPNYKMPGLQVPSYVMLGIPKHEEAPSTPQRPLSSMGEACSRMDLTAIHQILVTAHYRDDEGTNEVSSVRCLACACRAIYTGNIDVSFLCIQLSFQEWTQQMRDMLEARKRGDFAFRDKDFKTAIDCYSQV